MLKPHIRTLLPLALLVATTLAQNTNTTTPANGTCSAPSYDLDAPVNASAVVPVNLTAESWYLSVSLNDTRTDTSASQRIDGWISMPAKATGRTCIYFLSKLLPTQSSGAPNGACTGSLSESCIDMLERSIVLSAEDDCPTLPGPQALEKACGGTALANGYQSASISRPLDVANTTCTPPRVAGVPQPPATYTNHALFGIIFNSADSSDAKNPGNFTWYDKYVTQPMPWIVAVEDRGETRTRVVCVAPRQVQGGSREPVASAAGRVGVGAGFWGAVVVGVVMAML